MIKQLKLIFAAGMLAASGVASATQCQGPLGAIASYNIAVSICSGNPVCIAQATEQFTGSHPECFGANLNTAAAVKGIQATSFDQISVNSSAFSNRLKDSSTPAGKLMDSGQRTGLAAGNPAGKWNVWASVAETNTKFDRGNYFFNAAERTNKFDNKIENLVVGGDYQLAPNLVLGLSGAFDSGRGSAASYTIAAPDGSKSVRTSGASYAPYIGWQINKDLALDATIGWGNGKSTVDGSIRSETGRFFYGTNLSYTSWKGNWQLTGKGSYLFGKEESGDSNNNGTSIANSKVTNEIGQFRLGGQAAYWMNGFMPYFGLGYAWDANRYSSTSAAQQDATAMGKSAWVWSLGVNLISVKNAITGGIGYEQETGRERSKNDKLMANINLRF